MTTLLSLILAAVLAALSVVSGVPSPASPSEGAGSPTVVPHMASVSGPDAGGTPEAAATPPVGDVGPVDWGEPSPTPVAVHAPSRFHRVYPPATQAARDWAWRRIGTRQFACLDALWHFESGWRVAAGNPDGSFGIPQANPGRKMASEGRDWRMNPMTQVRWGVLRYIPARYGTPCRAWAFWQANRWY